MLHDDCQQSGAASSSALPLGYARGGTPLSGHSFYSCLSLAMVAVANVWLLYVGSCFGSGPPHRQAISANPLGIALYNTYPVPGIISVVLAVVGILHRGRKRTFSYCALALDALIYLLLMPPMNFA